MPLPLLAVAGAKAAEFAPIILSTIGAFLPTIIDAFQSGKSPEEVSAEIKPKYDELRDRLIGSGMDPTKAEQVVQESIQSEAAKAGAPEEMNPWLSMALMGAGAVAGHKLGGMARSKYGTTARKAATEAGHEAKLVGVEKRLADEQVAAEAAMPKAKPAAAAPVQAAPALASPFPGAKSPKADSMGRPGWEGTFAEGPGAAAGGELSGTVMPFPGLPSKGGTQNTELLKMVKDLQAQEAVGPAVDPANYEVIFKALAS